MTFNPIEKSNSVLGNNENKSKELQDIDLSSLNFDEIDKQVSLFMKGNKFIPVSDEVKLVSVEKNGKIIYEDEGKMQLANSQAELAEAKNEEDIPFKGFWGGFFGQPKSTFDKNKSSFA